MQALIKYIDGISDEDIPDLYVPIGMPLVYELDEHLKAVNHYEVADRSKARQHEG